MSKKKLLIIVDMINGFINEGPMADYQISQIIPSVVNQVKQFITSDDDIIAFIDAHSHDAIEFKAYPPHCLIGSSESQLITELLPFASHMTLIEKNSTNGFHIKSFQDLINQTNYNEFVIVGCCSDICVMQLALSLKTYFNQLNIDKPIIVIEDAIATFDSPEHPKDTYHLMALNLMRNAAINVSKGQDYDNK